MSLNLPGGLPWKPKGDEAEFYHLLDDRLVLARKALDTALSDSMALKPVGTYPLYGRPVVCAFQRADDVSQIFKMVARRFHSVTLACMKP